MSAPGPADAAAPPASTLVLRGERGNLHHEAVVILRRMIIEGELEFGQRIPEAALCAQLGISRTPLREAIRILSSEGLVTLLPRRGALVATPSMDEVRGLFIALGALESAAAPLACDHLTVADVEDIKALHAVMIEAGRAGCKRDYSLANQSIHASIVAGARNAFLSQLHKSLTVRLSRVRFFVETPPQAWRRSVDEHIAILAALNARDGRRLAACLADNLHHSYEDFARLSSGQPARIRIADA
jgi:DNA-binding GntR family transcriptional regulator